jgi:putative membrane protein
MFKNLIGGMAVGVANIIPGVSGGTIMVVIGLFDRIIESVSRVAKLDNPYRKKDILFLFQVLLGAAAGLVAFANLIDWLFLNYPTHTMFWFIGLIALSIPSVVKKELKGHSVSWFPLLAAAAMVLTMNYLNPGESVGRIDMFPAVTPLLVIQLLLISLVAGGTMLLPGVSGSMFLLIIGQYDLFKSYVASVLDFDLIILIPLFIIGIGVILGILLSAKLTQHFLKKHRAGTVSFILGLIIASVIVLFPTDAVYDGPLVLTSALSFLFGAGIILSIEKYA